MTTFAHRTPRRLPPPELDVRELQYLIDCNEWPPRAAARVGYTVPNLARWLQRHGHYELARVFDEHTRTERTYR